MRKVIWSAVVIIAIGVAIFCASLKIASNVVNNYSTTPHGGL